MFKPFAAATILLLLPLAAAAEGDAAKGEKVFRKCQACHMVGEGAENRVGPELNGVIGRPIASIDGFAYSDGMKALGADGKTWTAEELAVFLEKPRTHVKGTKMAFAGLRKPQERDDVIAYLATFPAP